MHVPLFKQGEESQGSGKISQNVPLMSPGHSQIKPNPPPPRSPPLSNEKHVPLFKQGDCEHGSINSSHVGPVLPMGQVHWNPPTAPCSCSHVPPPMQGSDAQGSKSSSHVAPVKSLGHMQKKLPMRSMHVPLFMQGEESQSSMLMEQFAPVYPAIHSHVDEMFPSTHNNVPSASHDASRQKSMSSSQEGPSHP